MTEVSDLIAILGHVDAQIHGVDDPLRATVAALVPAYRDPGRVGWFEQLTRHPQVGPFPTLEEAMGNLGEGTTYPSLLPRQVLAVALAARVFPDRFGPGGTEEGVALAALTVRGVLEALDPVPVRSAGDEEGRSGPGAAARGHDDPSPDSTTSDSTPPASGARGPSDSEGQARALLIALADPGRLRRLEDWPTFLVGVDHLVSDQLQAMPVPCSATVVERSAPGARPVTLLQTSLCVPGVQVADLDGFLEPSNWPGCSPWWCAMQALDVPPNVRDPLPPMRRSLYYEVVAAPCADDPIFEVAVFLHFAWPDVGPDRRVLTYTMAHDQDLGGPGMPANHMVDIDSGVIEVRQDGDCVRIETTKRIRFTEGIGVDAVAMLACWVGYGDVGTDLIASCSRLRTAGTGVGSAPGAGPVGRYVELIESCTADAGAEARRLAERLQGHYGIGEAAEDASRSMWLALKSWRKVAIAYTAAAADLADMADQGGRGAARRAAASRSFPFGQKAVAGWRLELPGLVSPYGEAAGYQLAPTVLMAEDRDLRVTIADTTTLAGSAYLGTVTAKDQAGSKVWEQTVYVIVP